MTSRSLDFHKTSFSPKSFPISPFDSFENTKTVLYPLVDLHFESSSKSSIEALHKILKRLTKLELSGQKHFETYLHYVRRLNRRPRILYSLYTGIVLFLGMIKENGNKHRRDGLAF